MSTLNYTVVFQKEPEGGYTAFAPLLPGCVTYGKDLPEAKKMAKEAIGIYIESLEAHKEDDCLGDDDVRHNNSSPPLLKKVLIQV